MKLKPIHLLLVLMAMAAGASSVNAQTSGDPEPGQGGEILAQAPFLVGEGSITIAREFEDGVPTISIAETGRIGHEYRIRPEWERLPLPQRVALLFADISGKPLPDRASRALVELEALQAARRSGDQEELATALLSSDEEDFTTMSPRNGAGEATTCPNFGDNDYYAYFNCIVNGPVTKVVSKPNATCLHTAAINGNHTQAQSYKSINGKFYFNWGYPADVKQGHYRKFAHYALVSRTRKGKIFNASASDKTFFFFVARNPGDYSQNDGNNCYAFLNYN